MSQGSENIPVEVSRTADGGTAPGIVLLQLIALGLDIQAPPGLPYLLDVIVRVRIERSVALGIIILECGIGVSQDGDLLRLGRGRHRGKGQESQDEKSLHGSNSF